MGFKILYRKTFCFVRTIQYTFLIKTYGNLTKEFNAFCNLWSHPENEKDIIEKNIQC